LKEIGYGFPLLGKMAVLQRACIASSLVISFNSEGVTPWECCWLFVSVAIFEPLFKVVDANLVDRTGFYMGYYNPDTEEEIKVCTDW
jgi:hypothetical protein